MNHNETKLRFAQILNSLLYFKISKKITDVLSSLCRWMTEFLTMIGSSENGEEHLNLYHNVETELGTEECYYISSEMNLLHAEQGEHCSECKDNESNVNSNQLKNCTTLTSTM